MTETAEEQQTVEEAGSMELIRRRRGVFLEGRVIGEDLTAWRQRTQVAGEDFRQHRGLNYVQFLSVSSGPAGPS